MQAGSSCSEAVSEYQPTTSSDVILDTVAIPNEVELVQRAAEVLGSQQVAAWMQSNVPSLGGETPYRLMQTPEGRCQVERVLLMIEHGVY
jgi:uncharacterized protein (DUF2384 family)